MAKVHTQRNAYQRNAYTERRKRITARMQRMRSVQNTQRVPTASGASHGATRKLSKNAETQKHTKRGSRYPIFLMQKVDRSGISEIDFSVRVIWKPVALEG